MKTFWKREHILKGAILVTIAWLCFSSMWMLAKLIGDQTTVPTMIFFRNVVGIVCVVPWIIKRWPKSLVASSGKIVLLRSVMGMINLTFIFLAVERISLVNATLLNNSAPFFVPILLYFWLKTPVQHKLWPAILTGFIGIALILQPDARIFNLGAVYGILSGMGLAVTIITMRMTSQRETFSTFLFYFFFIGLVISLPFAIAYWRIDNWVTLVTLIGMGTLSMVGQFFVYFAFKHAKAGQLSPFLYTSVIFAAIYSWLIWGNVPPLIGIIGAVLVIASGIWIVAVSKPAKEFKK